MAPILMHLASHPHCGPKVSTAVATGAATLSFVNDTKVLGFNNLSSSQTASLARMEQYEAAATAIAKAAAADATALTGCDPAGPGELACAEPYLHGLAKRAYRRPLTDVEKASLSALFAFNQDTVPYQTRLELAISAVHKRFVYSGIDQSNNASGKDEQVADIELLDKIFLH